MTKRNISLKYDDNFKQKVHGKKVNFNQEIFFNLTSNSQGRNYNKFIIENGANRHLDVWEKKFTTMLKIKCGRFCLRKH